MEHPILLLDFINKPLYHYLQEYFHLADSNHLYHVTYMWLYMLLLIIMSLLVVKSIKMIPGRLQNFVEVIIDGFRSIIKNTMGEEGMRFFPLIATIGIFILFANLGGVFPGFYSPTANINTNASYHWYKGAWDKICKAVYRACFVAGSYHDSY